MKNPFSRKSFLAAGSAAVANAALLRGGALPAGATQPVTIAIDRATTKGTLPAAIGGLSYEKQKLASKFFTGVNTNLIGCFKRLGPSVLRIGGTSVDRFAWGRGHTAVNLREVAEDTIDGLAEFIRKTNWQVIYGINLPANSPAAAVAEAKYVSAALGGNLLAFEFGNEQDLYPANGFRTSTYEPAQFFGEWNDFATAVHRELPQAPLGGPGTSFRLKKWTIPFAQTEASQLKFLSHHFYMGNGHNPASTMEFLLAPHDFVRNQLTQLQTAATENRLPGGYRLTEANSYYFGGARGVSNAYGSALWVVDFLLKCGLYGASGVNFHGGGTGPNNPFYTPLADVDGVVEEVRPIFYGLLLISRIASGPMYHVTTTTTLNVSAFAVAGRDGATYLVIVNKDPASPAAASVDLGASASSAYPLVLAGPSLDSLTGTTLGGSSIGNDGNWSPAASKPIGVSGSSLSVTVAPASAMLLKIT